MEMADDYKQININSRPSIHNEEEENPIHKNSEYYNLWESIYNSKHIKQRSNVNTDCSYEKNNDYDKSHKKKNAKTLNSDKGLEKKKIHLYTYCFICLVIIFFLIMGYALIYFDNNQRTDKNINIRQELMYLKQKFPNQNRMLWQNALKMMNSSVSQVQTLVLMYKKGTNVVAECLAKDLGQIINKKYNKGNNLSIYEHKKEIVDYGEELIFYKNIVNNTKHLIVFNLHEIPGKAVKFFHFLCDEHFSELKPSYFIFTLQDSSKEEKNQLLKKAGNILRNVWSDLLEHELTPLLVRIIKNVAEILPENINGCF